MRKKVLKISEKIFQKDLVVQKITLTFAPLSAENQRAELRAKAERSSPTKSKELFFIAIYRTAFFEVFEQLKFLSTLARE